MRISEILRIPTQHFPEHKVKHILQYAIDDKGEIDGLRVHYLEHNDERIVILTDSNGTIAAFAGFISRLNDKVWQAHNLQTYNQYTGNKLGAKIYKFAKESLKKSIQSDIEQSSGSENLWINTLPSLGLHPKIFDTESQYIIDQSYPEKYKEVLAKMYSIDESDPDKYRYTWILEKNDYYREHNILTEHRLLLPTNWCWCRFNNQEKL